MPHDRRFRFAQALDPSALATTAVWKHAIARAREDAAKAGVDAAHDCAVTLLEAQFAIVAGVMPDHAVLARLRQQCRLKCDWILAQPTLALLGTSDLGVDEPRKCWFHAEARKALTAIADGLGLPAKNWTLRHDWRGSFDPGSIWLETPEFAIEVTAGRKYGANVGLYDRCQRVNNAVARPQWRSLTQLLDAPVYAAWLKRELALPDQSTPLAAYSPVFGPTP